MRGIKGIRLLILASRRAQSPLNAMENHAGIAEGGEKGVGSGGY